MTEIERCQKICHQPAVGGFVQRDSERTVVVFTQVDLAFACRVGNLACGVRASFAQANSNRVKDGTVMSRFVTETLKSFGQCCGEPLNPASNIGQSFGAVIDRVKRIDNR